jgi:hypothetical protein
MKKTLSEIEQSLKTLFDQRTALEKKMDTLINQRTKLEDLAAQEFIKTIPSDVKRISSKQWEWILSGEWFDIISASPL